MRTLWLERAAGGDLFLYEGSGHLIAERASADFDAAQARLLTERVLGFLARF